MLRQLAPFISNLLWGGLFCRMLCLFLSASLVLRLGCCHNKRIKLEFIASRKRVRWRARAIAQISCVLFSIFGNGHARVAEEYVFVYVFVLVVNCVVSDAIHTRISHFRSSAQFISISSRITNTWKCVLSTSISRIFGLRYTVMMWVYMYFVLLLLAKHVWATQVREKPKIKSSKSKMEI